MQGAQMSIRATAPDRHGFAPFAPEWICMVYLFLRPADRQPEVDAGIIWRTFAEPTPSSVTLSVSFWVEPEQASLLAVNPAGRAEWGTRN